MRYRNIAANLMPGQVASQYPEDVLESIVGFRATNETATDGVVRPTIEVEVTPGVYDVHYWMPNPNKGKTIDGKTDPRPSCWVKAIAGEVAVAA